MKKGRKPRVAGVVRATRGDTLTRIRQIHSKKPGRLGPKLGLVAIEANIPPKMIALLIGTTEPTIFRWYYGETEPLQIYMTRVAKVIRILELALHHGELPLEAHRDEVATRLEYVVKKYISQLKRPD